ncbi:tyrosine-type recombinase/integrase [Mongoliibacter ruber]|uniref:Site-specific recombinase XerD n=1 Tax=Mongoliibacter ruber TaxID=1750599 RepID=A0A2T0WVD6_9BACT|nr:site-specific integrase [Mongoliibacter ruber]PRY90544.1 site-specific recombinase XerD [Mongoliibacter ruber]
MTVELGKPVFPYKLAHLNDANGDISKRWCISFHVYSTVENNLIRKQLWISAKIKNKQERYRIAKKQIAQINALLAEGYHVGQEPAKKEKVNGSLLTWLEAFDWVYDHREPNLRKRSIQSLELIRKELKLFLQERKQENLALVLVDHAICDAYMQWIRKRRKLGNSSYNNNLTYLKINFNYLVKNQKLLVNPAKAIAPLKIEEPAVYSFPKEVKLNLMKAYEEEEPPLKIFAQFIYYTFIRPGELRRLKVRDVLEKTINIPGTASKNRRSEHVIISPAMERLLVKLKVREFPPNYFLIGPEGIPSTKQVYINNFTRRHLIIRKKLGLISEYTLYCWKHTGVVDTYQATLDIEFVSRQCRHSSLDMTKRYLRGLGLLPEYPRQQFLPDLGL